MISRFAGKYSFLSNFQPCSVSYGGMRFATVEHAFQAAKFVNSRRDMRLIQLQPSPALAKSCAHQIDRRRVRSDWDRVKIEVMRALVFEKFSTDSTLRALLLDTGNLALVEGNDWRDVFWGVSDGVGENWLGRILMETRAQLRQESPGV